MQYIEATHYEINGKRGKVTLAQACPWRAGDGVTIKRTRKGSSEQRMNINVERPEGNTFEFTVPSESNYFSLPDFTTGPVVVKG